MTSSPDNELRIRIEIDSVTLVAALHDSNAARDFRDLLPLQLTLQDYAGKEKISHLPRRLDVTTAPPGAAGAIGDIAYDAPWGNLALVYRDAPYADGLVTLGRIEGDVSVLRGKASRQARIVRG
jgi:hypothetical protein